jgi:hypothetical protein
VRRPSSCATARVTQRADRASRPRILDSPSPFSMCRRARDSTERRRPWHAQSRGCGRGPCAAGTTCRDASIGRASRLLRACLRTRQRAGLPRTGAKCLWAIPPAPCAVSTSAAEVAGCGNCTCATMAVPTTKVTFSVLARGLKPGETVHLSGDGPLGHFQAARAMPLTRAEAAKKPAAPSASSAATAVVWQTAKPIILARDVPLRYRQVRAHATGYGGSRFRRITCAQGGRVPDASLLLAHIATPLPRFRTHLHRHRRALQVCRVLERRIRPLGEAERRCA